MLDSVIMLLLGAGVICLGFAVLGMVARLVEWALGLEGDE